MKTKYTQYQTADALEMGLREIAIELMATALEESFAEVEQDAEISEESETDRSNPQLGFNGQTRFQSPSFALNLTLEQVEREIVRRVL